MARPPTGATSAQSSNLPAQTNRRITQLFSDPDTQQTIHEATSEASQLQQQFNAAALENGRKRVSFVDFVRPPTEEEDEEEEGDNDELYMTFAFGDISFTFQDLQDLDEMGEEVWAGKVRENPEFWYKVMGSVMDLTRRARAERLAALQANRLNWAAKKDLEQKLAAAEVRVGEKARDAQRLAESKDKAKQYRGHWQTAKTQNNKLQSNINDLNEKVLDLDALEKENEELKSKLADRETRGRRRNVSVVSDASSMTRELAALNRPDTPDEPTEGEELERAELAHREEMERTLRAHNEETDRLRAELSAARRLRPLSTRRGEREGTEDTSASSSSVRINNKLDGASYTDKHAQKPKTFDNDKIDFHEWIQTLELNLNSSSFRTEEDGMRHILGFTTGIPNSVLRSRVPTRFGQQCPNPFKSTDDMIKFMFDMYGKVNNHAKAFNGMSKLRMKNDETFSEFFVRYQEFSSWLGFDDANQVYTLRSKLSSRYSSRLADGVAISSFALLVERLYNMEEQFAEHDCNHRPSTDSKAGTGKASATTKKTPAAPKSSGPDYLKTNPNIPEKYKNLPALTDAEREKCRVERRCMRCREQGHVQSDYDKCPLSKKNTVGVAGTRAWSNGGSSVGGSVGKDTVNVSGNA